VTSRTEHVAPDVLTALSVDVPGVGTFRHGAFAVVRCTGFDNRERLIPLRALGILPAE
jgi:hypothetical protein